MAHTGMHPDLVEFCGEAADDDTAMEEMVDILANGPSPDSESQSWQIVENLLREVKRAREEIEHLNKMFCLGCGACGTECEYAECTCEH